MKSKVFMVLSFAVILILGTVGIASAKGTLVFASSADVENLDPANVSDCEAFQRLDNITEGLLAIKAGTTEIEPCLATSWEISADGTEIVFNLRKGVKFHDGTDFNADAVVFSFARQYDTTHPYHQYGVWPYWGYLCSDIKEMEKIDDYTVKLVLKRPNAAIMSMMTLYTMHIVSPANAEKYKEDADKHPCGTGPFKFVEWVKGDHITLEANENYWRERAQLDKLIFKVITDSSARLMALEVGEVQGMSYPNPADFARIKANKDLVLMTQEGMNVGYMAMNKGYGYEDANKNGVRDPDEPWVKTPGYFEPLTKKKVRQAINMAINKQSIIDNLFMGTAIKAKNGMPPFMLGYNDEIQDYPYDPVKAKQLLTEAGYPDGFEVTLYVMSETQSFMFDPPKIGEAIQSYLAAVGITVKLYQVDMTTYYHETRLGKHQMCLLGWTADIADPDNFMNMLYGTDSCKLSGAAGRSFFNDECVDVQDLLSQALRIYDKDKRAELYKKAQVFIHEDAGWVYLSHSLQTAVFRKNVHGFVLNPLLKLFFYPVSVE